MTKKWPGDGLHLIQLIIEKNLKVGQGMFSVFFSIIYVAVSSGLVWASLDCVVSDKIENLFSVLSVISGLERTNEWLGILQPLLG